MRKEQKKVRQKEKADKHKQPELAVDPCSYLSSKPKWAFRLCDREHPRWALSNNPDKCNYVLDKLISYEGMTWAEIQEANGGRKKGTNNHFEKISDLIDEAQQRAKELRIQSDELFSLRLGGTVRLYGIVEDGLFSVIWLDTKHEIYRVKK